MRKLLLVLLVLLFYPSIFNLLPSGLITLPWVAKCFESQAANRAATLGAFWLACFLLLLAQATAFMLIVPLWCLAPLPKQPGRRQAALALSDSYGWLSKCCKAGTLPMDQNISLSLLWHLQEALEGWESSRAVGTAVSGNCQGRGKITVITKASVV